MAYAINNITPFAPNAIPLNIVTLADQSADVAAQNMTVSGCRFIKVRILVKTLTGTTPAVQFRIGVDSVVGMTSTEVVAYTAAWLESSVTAETYNFELWGWSNATAGFQYVNIDQILTGTTPAVTWDAQITVW